MFSVIMLSVIMLSVIMLSVIISSNVSSNLPNIQEGPNSYSPFIEEGKIKYW
jgi:hypothetical protein